MFLCLKTSNNSSNLQNERALPSSNLLVIVCLVEDLEPVFQTCSLLICLTHYFVLRLAVL